MSTEDKSCPALTWCASVQDGEGVDPNGGGVEEGQRSEAIRDRVILWREHTKRFSQNHNNLQFTIFDVMLI